MAVVIRNVQRVERSLLRAFAPFGVATVHEAQGRTGLLAPYMRPIYPGAHLIGSAVTVSVPPGDNWMIRVAVEQCQEDDVLVVAPTAPSHHGYFGELLASSLKARGVRGLIIEAGVRDVRALQAMDFPVWSRFVSAQGTIKGELGDVNRPLQCAGVLIHPGDLIVADDDGVCAVPRARAADVLEASKARESREAGVRRRLAAGELGLDLYDMRPALAAKGLQYLDEEP